MRHNLILTGDINLLGVTDPTIPFARVRDRLHAADVVFANLECCFYEPEVERSPEDEGFYAPLKAAEALSIAGIHAVGNANNVNYGAAAIRSSLKRLDELSIRHTGAGVDIVSHHWGLDHEVLAYQVEIAHAAIDAGADLVMGHGPHMPLGIEIYRDKPIFYGVGSFSFETGHRGRAHPDWIGLMLHVAVEDAALVRAAFSFVRHNAQNETVPRPIAAEQAELDQLRRLSARFSTALEIEGDEVVVWP